MKTCLLFLVLLLCTSFMVSAQQSSKTITGVVTSFEESLPLEGVVVAVKGAATTSGTQGDGVYYIPVKSDDVTLVFSLKGYETKEVKINGKTSVDVYLVRAAAGSGLR